jgi:hypothetical protein
MRLKLVLLSASLALAISLTADAVCKFIGSDFDSVFPLLGARYPTPDPVTGSVTLSDRALPSNWGLVRPFHWGLHSGRPQGLFNS